jgi:hypothetical protein
MNKTSLGGTTAVIIKKSTATNTVQVNINPTDTPVGNVNHIW